ncbi:MAG: hypothetical protein RLZZ299_96 [Pseudomonadota bacterium]|jgi:thioredoxin 1
MASVPYVNEADFTSTVLDSSIPVLVDFTAAWCGPCKAIAPLLDQVSEQHAGALKVVKVDVDQNPVTAARFNVRSIPALFLLKDGKVVDQRLGALNRTALDQFVAKVLA